MRNYLALGLTIAALATLGLGGLAWSEPLNATSPSSAPSPDGKPTETPTSVVGKPADALPGDEEGLGGIGFEKPPEDPVQDPPPLFLPPRKVPAAAPQDNPSAVAPGKTNGPPIVAPPAQVPVPLQQANLPPATVTALVSHDVAAIDQVKRQVVRQVLEGKMKAAVGKQIWEAADRLAHEGGTPGPAGVPPPIRHNIGANLSELLRVRDKSQEAANHQATPGPDYFSKSVALSAFGGTVPAGSAVVDGRGTGTPVFTGPSRAVPTGKSASPTDNQRGAGGSPQPGPAGPSNPSGVGARSPGTRVFSPPAVMDDSAYQRHFYRSLRPTVVPSPTSPTSGANEPKNFRPKGVKILIDEAALARAMQQQETKVCLAEIEALEDALLQARDSSEALGKLQEYTQAKLTAFLESTRRFHNVDRVRLVSLKKLLAQLAPYRQRWQQRPQDLRTVAGLTRIHGFVRSPAGDDLFLVGRAEPGRPLISVDNLILGLRCVWQQGLTPGCSLDPEPGNIAGPQYSRIIGVPEDSAFAKIMLDADYAMKRILMEVKGEELHIAGFESLAALASRGPAKFDHRFWLFPVQPTAREIQLGPDGTSALFEARVQVLTQSMADAQRCLVGAGQEGAPCEEASRSFTAHYEEIAQRRPIFRELHGLFDIVLLARVLRMVSPQDALLASLGALPYDKVDVPRTYAGVTVEIGTGNEVSSLSGGCDLRARVGTGTIIEARSRSLDALSGSAARAWQSAALARDLAGAPLALPEAAGGATGEEETAYQRGVQLLARQRFAEARDQFSAALARDDTFAAAYAQRAVARWQLGEHGPALEDAALAVRLDPADVSLRATYAQLLLDAGGRQVLKDLDTPTRTELAGRYLVRAALAAVKGSQEEVLTACSRAVEVDPRNATAYALRAAVRCARREDGPAEADVRRAVAIDPRQCLALWVRAHVRFRRHDFAAAVDDINRILKVHELADFVAERGLCRFFAGDVEGAANDAERARALAPYPGSTQRVDGTLRLCLLAGPERARDLVFPILELPPPIARALATAHCARDMGQSRTAVVFFDKVLALLRQEAANPAVRQAPLVAEELDRVLMITLGDAYGSGSLQEHQEARRRIDAISAAMRQRHPDWISPYLGRAVALQHLGDFDEASRAYEGILALGVATDPLLGPLFPKGGLSLEGFVLIHRIALLVVHMHNTLGAQPEANQTLEKLLATLDRLAEVLKSSPVLPACRGLRTYFAGFKDHTEMAFNPQKWLWQNPADRAKLPAGLCETLRTFAAQLSGRRDVPLPLLDAAVLGLFSVYALNLEAAAGSADRAEALARDFFRRSTAGASSPAASMFDDLRLIGRDDACQAVFFLYTRQIDKDDRWNFVRSKLAGLPALDAGAAETELCQAAAEWVERARKIGEPALVYLTREGIRWAAREEVLGMLHKTIARLNKLTEVVADPEQQKSLQAELARTTKQLQDFENADKKAIPARIEAAYRKAQTVLEVQTLDKVLPFLAELAGPRGALYRPPASSADLRYQLQLKRIRPHVSKKPPGPARLAAAAPVAPAPTPTVRAAPVAAAPTAGGSLVLGTVLAFSAVAFVGVAVIVWRRSRV